MAFMNRCKKNTKMPIFITISLVLYLAGIATTTFAQARETQKLDMLSGKSIVVPTYQKVKRISISDPAIADFILISPTEIYITARGVGITNMLLWYEKGGHDVYDVEVQYDILRLKQQIQETLPNEKDLRVTAMQGTITLSGRVSRATNLSHALALAKA